MQRKSWCPALRTYFGEATHLHGGFAAHHAEPVGGMCGGVVSSTTGPAGPNSSGVTTLLVRQWLARPCWRFRPLSTMAAAGARVRAPLRRACAEQDEWRRRPAHAQLPVHDADRRDQGAQHGKHPVRFDGGHADTVRVMLYDGARQACGNVETLDLVESRASPARGCDAAGRGHYRLRHWRRCRCLAMSKEQAAPQLRPAGSPVAAFSTKACLRLPQFPSAA